MAKGTVQKIKGMEIKSCQSNSLCRTRITKGGAKKIVKLTELDEEYQALVNRIVKDSRLQFRVQVAFVPQSLPKDDLRDELCRAPAAAQPTTGFVGIFYDPKLSGEPIYRPGIRTAPIRDDTYANLIKIILNRHAVQANAIGERDVFL